MSSAPPLTLPVAERIRELHSVGLPIEDIATQTGIRLRTVNEVVRGRRDGRPLTAREQADEDERTGWAPLCLDAAEWAEWRSSNPLGIAGAIARPCDDCPIGFAADMRAAGRCNGTPGWTAPDPDEEPAVTPAEEAPIMAEPLTMPAADGTPETRALRLHIATSALERAGGDHAAAAAALGITTQVLGLALFPKGSRRPKNTPGSKAPGTRPERPAGPRVAKSEPVPAGMVHTTVEAFLEPRRAPELVISLPSLEPNVEPVSDEVAQQVLRVHASTAPAEAEPEIDYARIQQRIEQIANHVPEPAPVTIATPDVLRDERAEILVIRLREAFREAGFIVAELDDAAELAPMLRPLARQARRLRREIAVSWADRA